MKQYLDIVRDTLTGEPKKPFRIREQQDVTETVGIFAAIFRHKMSDGFPLLTTKKMSLKNIAVELEGFIKGITDKKWYQERGCHIWDEWSNPVAVAKAGFQATLNGESWIKSIAQKQIKDLGPIYGYQWRSFGQIHDDGGSFDDLCCKDNGIATGSDQLQAIIDSLEKNPTDRRMVCSAWNPNQIAEMALPPCHFAWNVVVYNNKLNLIWHQRSCDLMLGVPYNIASYALLLKLLARHAKLDEGELVGTLNDCHIYGNQLEQAREQLKREPLPLPKVVIPNNDGDKFSLWNWDYTQLSLEGYEHRGKLSFELTV